MYYFLYVWFWLFLKNIYICLYADLTCKLCMVSEGHPLALCEIGLVSHISACILCILCTFGRQTQVLICVCQDFVIKLFYYKKKGGGGDL